MLAIVTFLAKAVQVVLELGMKFLRLLSLPFLVAIGIVFLCFGLVYFGTIIAYRPETDGQRVTWQDAKYDLAMRWTMFLERVTPAKLVTEEKIGRYTVRYYERKYQESWRLRVLNGKKAVCDIKGGRESERAAAVDWRIYAGPGNPLLPDKASSTEYPDITGDGRPKLFVSTWTGGAHCCWDLEVFELGPDFKAVASFDNVYGEGPRFEDLDHDGVMEAIVLDGTFDYEFTAHAGSPFPEIILRRTKGTYVFADDLMRKVPLAAEDLEPLIMKVRAEFDNPDVDGQNGVPTSLYNEMLQLIYGGNADQAWNLFDLAWPPEKSGKLEELKGFQELLSRSPWWPDIRKLQPPR